ncbi:MAG: hypothetical protein K1X55_12215 [Chitinophagales bacterium]|nr:hypothetical protein [Chitinophagales bacterium]
MKEILKKYANDLLGYLLICITGIIQVHKIPFHLDLLPTDDAHYMSMGFSIGKKLIVNYGPLYCLWFKFLQKIFVQPITVYYVSFMAITVATPALLFGFLRRFNMGLLPAFIFAFLFQTSELNMFLNSWPKISHFAIIGVMTFIIATRNIKSPIYFYLLSTGFILVMSYVRPEYFLSFVFMVLWCVGYICFKNKLHLSKHQWFAVLAVCCLSALLLFALGSSMSGGRTGIAISQHYMWNYVEWHHLPKTAWLNWYEVSQKHFGQADSFSQFMQANPKEFFHMISYNFVQFFVKNTQRLNDVFFPKTLFRMALPIGCLIIGLLIILNIVFFGVAAVKKYFSQNIHILLVLLLFSLPALMSSVLIYPREHYLVLLLPLLYFIISGLLINLVSVKNTLKQGVALCVLGILSMVFVPRAGAYTYYNIWEAYEEQYCAKAINKIKSLSIKEHINLLESEGGIYVFIRKNISYVHGFYKQEPFYALLQKKKINMIYVSPILLADKHFYQDKEWQDFQQHYEKYGFKKIGFSTDKRHYLYVKASLN